jgi:hypothetical protein
MKIIAGSWEKTIILEILSIISQKNKINNVTVHEGESMVCVCSEREFKFGHSRVRGKDIGKLRGRGSPLLIWGLLTHVVDTLCL